MSFNLIILGCSHYQQIRMESNHHLLKAKKLECSSILSYGSRKYLIKCTSQSSSKPSSSILCLPCLEAWRNNIKYLLKENTLPYSYNYYIFIASSWLIWTILRGNVNVTNLKGLKNSFIILQVYFEAKNSIQIF